ncbi:MAG: hypothetical protein V3U73_02895 [bacterium]
MATKKKIYSFILIVVSGTLMTSTTVTGQRSHSIEIHSRLFHFNFREDFPAPF